MLYVQSAHDIAHAMRRIIHQEHGVDIMMRTKNLSVVRPRQMVMWFLHLRGYSHTRIGRVFGMSASSVTGAVDRALALRLDDQALALWDRLDEARGR